MSALCQKRTSLMLYLTHNPPQKFTAQMGGTRLGSNLVFVCIRKLKLVAKPSPPSLAVAIHSVDLVLNILFDSSSNRCREVRRRKNALNNLGRGTSPLVSIEQSPGRGTPNAKNDGLLWGGIEASSH